MLLGRLRIAIKEGKNSRALDLLELISLKVSQMDLKLPIKEREIF